MPTSNQEARWVLRAQCGDRQALESLLRRLQPCLQRYLVSLVGAADADDLQQEVLLLVCQNLAGLRVPELFHAWVYRIASRAVLRHLRNRSRSPERLLDESSQLEEIPAPAAEVPAHTLPELLKLRVLPPASRAVLVLHFQEQLSLPEVAAILEIPLGTVKSRLAAGLTALRNRYGKQERSP